MEETDKTKCCCNSPEGPTLFLEETSKCKISVHHRSGRLCRIDIGQRRFKAAVKNKAIVLRIFMVSVLLASMMVWELAFAASSEKVPVNAGEAVEAFEKALQTFDFKKIQESVRLIQANPDAMHLIEQNPALYKRFEEELFVLSKTPTPGTQSTPHVFPKGGPEAIDSGIGSGTPVKPSQPDAPGYPGKLIKVRPPGSALTDGNDKLDIMDIVKENRATKPTLSNKDAQKIRTDMPRMRRPSYRPSPTDPEIPLGPRSSWSDVMKASQGETILKDTPKFSKNPELSALADSRNTFINPEQSTPRLDDIYERAASSITHETRKLAYKRALQDADDRVKAFKEALKSRNPSSIKKANLRIQEDPLAVQQINKQTNYVKHRFNQATETIKAETMANVKSRVARKYRVTPDDVSVIPTTNLSNTPKVGQDWDVTVRVQGKDIPLDVAEPIVHQAYYDAAGGKKVAAGLSPKEFALKHHVEVTRYNASEAYGSSIREGKQIITNPAKPVRDPTQLSQVMEHKSNLAQNKGLDLSKKGNLMEAEKWRAEQVRQFTKQYTRQIKPRVKALGGKIPKHVKKGVNILKKVGKLDPATGKVFTTADAEVALRNIGETPSSIIKKATGLVESSQTLRPPGANASAADDFFAGNVKNQIDLKRMKAGRDLVDWNKPLKKPVSDDLPPGASRSGHKPLTRGKASFAKEVDAAEFAGKALQYTAQGMATTAAVSGKISEKGSQRLRDGKEWSLEDSAEVAAEGARSLPVTIMAEAMTMTGYEKSRKLNMEIEKKEQELQQAERLLAVAQAPDGPRDPAQIQAARQRVEEARKNLNDAWVQFTQETQGYYDPNQTVARIVQGKDTYVTDLADKTGKAIVETAKGLSITLEDVTEKNFDEMWAKAEKEGRRPTMGEGAEFYLKTGRDFASELGPRQAAEGLYDIATAWEADRAEIGAQKDLGEAFDRRFSYQESRLKHTQRELEQLLSQGDSKDPDVQQRKQELLARYRAHYDTIQKIPDLAGKYLNDPELRMRQIDAAMNKIHPSGKPQNLDEKLKEPATRQRWFELIDARKKLIQQAEGETHLTEEDRKRLANLRDKAGRLVQPDVLGEYAQDMLPDPYDHSTDGEGQSNRDDVSTVAGQAGQDKKDGFTFLDEGDTRSLERGQRVADAMDADGGFVFLRGETKPGGDANKEEISREDKAQVVEMSRRHGKESGAGFTFVGEEKAQADQVSRKNARAGGEFADPDDPETQQALKIVEDARRNPPSRPGWEIELDRHEQDYQRQMRASRLDMARSFHDMSRIIGRISHDSRKKRSRQKQSTSERKLPHRPKPVGSIGNRTKAQDIPRFRFEPSPETAWSYEEVSNASGRKPSASNTPPIKYSSGNTGSAMSWDACVEKHCPMCANQVTLLEVTPSDECNKCKKTKYAAIKACSSGNARRRQGVTVNKQAHSGVNKGAKVYFAARKYQPKYKNYHYVIGKKQYGGLVGHQILFGPDTYMGCRRWLIGKGYWK